MNTMTVNPVGVVRAGEDGFRLELDPTYASALEGLEDFSHVQVLWWFSGCDTEADRSILAEDSPYRMGPQRLGTFATRSPRRPNPLALTVAQVLWIDPESAVVGIAYTDAQDGTPILDIKPYTPSLDRVESPRVPAWCAHWPKSLEASAAFDWEKEMED